MGFKLPNISLENVQKLIAAFSYLVGQVGGIKAVIDAAQARGWEEDVSNLLENAAEADALAIEAGKRARP